MSLDVSPALLDRAQRDEVTDADFIDCIKTSLPYAWEVVSRLVDQTAKTGDPFADNHVAPPDEQAQGQLLRAMASNAMCGALERHFGVRIAFQNCHRVGVFTPAASEDAYVQFVSPRSQLLNQEPRLVNC
jgi:hypothetical protein